MLNFRMTVLVKFFKVTIREETQRVKISQRRLDAQLILERLACSCGPSPATDSKNARKHHR